MSNKPFVTRATGVCVNTTEALKATFGTLYLMTNLHSRILDMWKECSRIVVDRFQLETPPNPTSIRRIDKQDSLRPGGSYSIEENVLLITDEIVAGRIPLRGVVFRECLFSSLPNSLCQEAKRDLSYEFSRQSLGKMDRDNWISEWKKLPSKRVQANLMYSSLGLMTWIHTLGGNNELDLLVHEFECMFRYGKSLDFQQYVEYMMQRVQNIMVPLSDAEVKIIDSLMKNRDASYLQVSEISGLSKSWVCTRINHLKRKYVLKEHTVVPFSTIGIKTFHVLLSGPSWSDMSSLLKDCPFLYESRAILNGPWQSMVRLAVPDNHENIQSLKQMRSILESTGIACDISETHSVGVSNSFYHYNAKLRNWKIPWVAMQGWGHRIKEESIDHLIEPIDYPARTTDHYIDSLDIKIMDIIRLGMTSTKILRKELAVGQNKLLLRLKKLKAEGLIRRDWGVYNIGLVERVALRATDKRTASLLDAWSRELPRVYLRYEKNRHLLMVVELPLGGATKMMDTLRILKWPVTISPLSSAIWGHWQFPGQFWDVERQRWRAQGASEGTWLSSLSEECELLVSRQTESEYEFSTSPRTRR
jgi:DNA-binding Lrp family transcriptional regulator